MPEFRIVLQIEQMDADDNPLCIYGPEEPAVVLSTDDADEVIDTFENMRYTLRDEFGGQS